MQHESNKIRRKKKKLFSVCKCKSTCQGDMLEHFALTKEQPVLVQRHGNNDTIIYL